MKQKSGGIKRLMEFTGKHRGLLTVSRILSGISSVFILGPFLCVYFAARDLVGVFAGTPLDTNSLVRWGLLALGLELIGLLLYFSALLCSHVVAFHTEKNLKMAALKHLAKCLWDTLTQIPAENCGRSSTITVFRPRLSSLTSFPTWWAHRSQ